MLERARIQEVSQIILSVPQDGEIRGLDLIPGEPVMIIDRPSASGLSFSAHSKKDEDRGFIGAAQTIKSLDMTINEGTILYSVWSYLHGVKEQNTTSILKGTETLYLKNDKLELSAHTTVTNLIVYAVTDTGLNRLNANIDYTAEYEEIGEAKYYYIYPTNLTNKNYFVCYDYEIAGVDKTTVSQISNNIFCSLDIFFDGVDCDTDDKIKVCVHCDKVQIFMDLNIGINNSQKTSFTPIEIKSVPVASNDIIKDIATITVI